MPRADRNEYQDHNRKGNRSFSCMGRIDFWVEQGYEIGRPSLLYLRAEDKKGKIDVSVGGKVIMVAKGRKSKDIQKSRRIYKPIQSPERLCYVQGAAWL